MAAIGAQAQTFTTLANFDGINGEFPMYGSLVQGVNGDLYGTTSVGGSSDQGVIFQMTPQGQLQTLVSFDGSNGSVPEIGLTLTASGLLCGTTVKGGADGDGTVFQVTPGGQITALFSFDGSDGAGAFGGLVQGFDGALYGTTYYGGSSNDGVLFKVAPGGTVATLHSFSGADGVNPYYLVQAFDGSIYGTTTRGGRGEFGYGTIFAVAPSGAFRTVYDFQRNVGAEPDGLMQGTDGNFYGTTAEGGTTKLGTVFRITSGGALTVLHDFEGGPDGWFPNGGLVQGTDGNLYGTTYNGGANNAGTIFLITPAGKLTTLHNFAPAEGNQPYAGLVQGTDGSFYGTTFGGGTYGGGTVYRLSMGLGPFVKTVPWFGRVGAAVTILGTDLTGATSVTFDGTPTAFTVVSPTAIKATVPPGASTGTVQVVAPSGTFASNVPFRVHP
jgi:uncharacterized repeat protein (TIGR03803 family)